jgi:hypothetical protein
MNMDTSSYALMLQARILKKVTANERLRLAMDMSETARALTLARLRRDHADLSHDSVIRELLRCVLAPNPLPPAAR